MSTPPTLNAGESGDWQGTIAAPWQFSTDDGRTGSDPSFRPMHGDAIRDVLMAIEGPGWIPVPLSSDPEYGEYSCSHVDGRTLFVVLYR